MSQQELSREIQEVWALFRETREQIEKTDKQIERMSRKVEQVSETVNALTGKWGKFVEGLTASGTVNMFKERGIVVNEFYQCARSKPEITGEELDIDLIVVGDEHAIAISVKSTLELEDVNYLFKSLSRFREVFRHFADKKLIGAVAGIVIKEEADKYAYRKGLFVITQTGETVKILNDEKPRLW